MSRPLLHALWSNLVEIELRFLALAVLLEPPQPAEAPPRGPKAPAPAPAPEGPTRAPDWLVAYL